MFRISLMFLLGTLIAPVSAQSLTPEREATDVHIVVYSSYACPYCASWARDLETLMAAHPGRVSVQVQPFPIDPEREHWAIAAAEALAAQGALRALHESLFARVAGTLDAPSWRSGARAAGVDLARFDRDLERALAREGDVAALARAHGVRVAPTTFVDGIRLEGRHSLETVDTMVRARLEGAGTAAAANEGGAR